MRSPPEIAAKRGSSGTKITLIQVHIPYLDDLENTRPIQYKMFGIPADSFRSTVIMESVTDYMVQAESVLGNRWPEPRNSDH